MKKNNAIIIIILIILTILASLYFDSQIVQAVSLIRGEMLDDLFFRITYLSHKIVIFLFLTSLFLFQRQKQKWILPTWLTLGASVVISFLLKFSIQRFRPFQIGIVSAPEILQKASHMTYNFSFPSFQAMLGFCAIPILAQEFPKLKKIWIIFAVLIAFSRVYFGLHFLSDVIAGGLMGYLIGWVIVKQEGDSDLWGRVYGKMIK